jgi:hypothetical protein
MFEPRPLTFLIAVLLVPIAGTIVATAQAKAKAQPALIQTAKTKVLDQCMKNVAKEVGENSGMTVNEVCTCLTDRIPENSGLDVYLASKAGSKAFGNCLFLAKDGL